MKVQRVSNIIKKQYPLDNALVGAIGLEGGLKRFQDVLPHMPCDTISFVHEWNRALRDVLSQADYKPHLGPVGQAIVRCGNIPSTISKIIDCGTVPYRSYLYARRFLMAYNFVAQKIHADKVSVIYDFGRGLSPLTHMIGQYFGNAMFCSSDANIMNTAVFSRTTDKIGLKQPMYFMPRIKKVPINSVYISLGAYAGMPIDAQEEELRWVSENIQNFYIELEFDKNQPETNSVNQLVPECKTGWDGEKLQNILGPNSADNNWSVSPLWPNPDAAVRFDRFSSVMHRALLNAPERFLER